MDSAEAHCRPVFNLDCWTCNSCAIGLPELSERLQSIERPLSCACRYRQPICSHHKPVAFRIGSPAVLTRQYAKICLADDPDRQRDEAEVSLFECSLPPDESRFCR